MTFDAEVDFVLGTFAHVRISEFRGTRFAQIDMPRGPARKVDRDKVAQYVDFHLNRVGEEPVHSKSFYYNNTLAHRDLTA